MHSYILALAGDPMGAYKDGGLLAVAILLFFLNFQQNYGIKKSNESLLKSNESLVSAVKESNTAVATQLSALAKTLGEGQKALTENLASVIKNQEILATNQSNQTHTTNEVVRELISVIREER